MLLLLMHPSGLCGVPQGLKVWHGGDAANCKHMGHVTVVACGLCEQCGVPSDSAAVDTLLPAAERQQHSRSSGHVRASVRGADAESAGCLEARQPLLCCRSARSPHSSMPFMIPRQYGAPWLVSVVWGAVMVAGCYFAASTARFSLLPKATVQEVFWELQHDMRIPFLVCNGK